MKNILTLVGFGITLLIAIPLGLILAPFIAISGGVFLVVMIFIGFGLKN